MPLKEADHAVGKNVGVLFDVSENVAERYDRLLAISTQRKEKISYIRYTYLIKYYNDYSLIRYTYLIILIILFPPSLPPPNLL